jgi:hypothetical protein
MRIWVYFFALFLCVSAIAQQDKEKRRPQARDPDTKRKHRAEMTLGAA